MGLWGGFCSKSPAKPAALKMVAHMLDLQGQPCVCDVCECVPVGVSVSCGVGCGPLFSCNPVLCCDACGNQGFLSQLAACVPGMASVTRQRAAGGWEVPPGGSQRDPPPPRGCSGM